MSMDYSITPRDPGAGASALPVLAYQSPLGVGHVLSERDGDTLTIRIGAASGWQFVAGRWWQFALMGFFTAAALTLWQRARSAGDRPGPWELGAIALLGIALAAMTIYLLLGRNRPTALAITPGELWIDWPMWPGRGCIQRRDIAAVKVQVLSFCWSQRTLGWLIIEHRLGPQYSTWLLGGYGEEDLRRVAQTLREGLEL